MSSTSFLGLLNLLSSPPRSPEPLPRESGRRPRPCGAIPQGERGLRHRHLRCGRRRKALAAGPPHLRTPRRRTPSSPPARNWGRELLRAEQRPLRMALPRRAAAGRRATPTAVRGADGGGTAPRHEGRPDAHRVLPVRRDSDLGVKSSQGNGGSVQRPRRAPGTKWS